MFRKWQYIMMVVLASVLCVSMVVSCAEGPGAEGEQPGELPTYHWRLAHQYAPTNVEARRAVAFAEEVADKSDGRITIDVYPSGELGTGELIWDELIAGSEVIQFCWGATYGDIDARLIFNEIPFVVTTWAEAKDSLSAGGWQSLLFDKLFKESALKSLGTWPVGFQGIGFMEMPPSVGNPDVPKKMKVRVSPAPGAELFFKELGYLPVHMNWGDVFTAMTTGVIDGYTGAWAEAAARMMMDCTKVWIQSNHVFLPHMLYVNLEFWNSLDKEAQEILQNAATAQMAVGFGSGPDSAEKANDEGRKIMREAGIEVYYYTAEERQKITTRTYEEVYPLLEEIYTKELMDELRLHVQK